MEIAELSTLILTDREAAGDSLDRALTDMHGSGDPKAMLNLHMLAVIYWRGDPQRIAFHQTHALVYALEAGLWDSVDELHDALAVERRI